MTLTRKGLHGSCRLRDQKPVVEAFLAWINKQNAPNGSRPARALTYARNRWETKLAVPRYNGWCRCRHDGIFTLLETARSNGLNPQKYLEYLLEARPDKNMSDEELEK